MAAEIKEAKREALPADLREKYVAAKANYEALWQTQLDDWEVQPPPVRKFEEMVGTENFIKESQLIKVKAGGAGSFATGPPPFLGTYYMASEPQGVFKLNSCGQA